MGGATADETTSYIDDPNIGRIILGGGFVGFQKLEMLIDKVVLCPGGHIVWEVSFSTFSDWQMRQQISWRYYSKTTKYLSNWRSHDTNLCKSCIQQDKIT